MTSIQSTNIAANKERLCFIQMLRAVSCLLVVYYHLGETYWTAPGLVAELLNFNPISGFKIYHLVYRPGLFDFGSYGVGIFFLISGFVIPLSLKKVKPSQFLLHRVCRIFPSLIAVITLICATSYAYSKYLHKEYTHNFITWLTNVTLIAPFWKMPLIEYSTWTLVIEGIFYIICACLMYAKHQLRSIRNFICLSSLASIGFVYLANNSTYFLRRTIIDKFMRILSNDLIFITYIFIGTCFYMIHSAYDKQIKWHLLLFYILFAILLYITPLYYAPHESKLTKFFIPYNLALMTFALFYYKRKQLKFSRWLNFFAEISYPLYLVHVVMGYTLITIFYNIVHEAYLSLFLTLVTLVLVSSFIHNFIELPFQRISYRHHSPRQE